MDEKPLYYALTLGAITVISYLARMNFSQILSVTVFASLIVGTLFYWRFRLAFAPIGSTANIVAIGMKVKQRNKIR